MGFRVTHRLRYCLSLFATVCIGGVLCAQVQEAAEYQRRVDKVTGVPGLAGFWDFVARDEQGRFVARTASKGAAGAAVAYPLEAWNYVKPYWHEGRDATYEDFPLWGRGPFGQGVVFRNEADRSFRPTLVLPREQFHGGPIDVGGPGQSVSMVVWLIYQEGNHAIAGIWHEGTDLRLRDDSAARVELGRRQYALFAGLAANRGANAIHVSENGRASFGDKYARNLAVTGRSMPQVNPGADAATADAHWTAVGFVFDNEKNQVVAYMDGVADDYWIDQPEKHPFFQWPARGWRQAYLHQLPGMQQGEDPDYPADQFYTPPEDKARSRKLLSKTKAERVWELSYEFTKVRVTEKRDAVGAWTATNRELVSLRVNPFWFAHDLFQPQSAEEGGPFTIGRVIHSGRGVGISAVIGGVAVYNRALSAAEMRKLAAIGFEGKGGRRRPSLLHVQPRTGAGTEKGTTAKAAP